MSEANGREHSPEFCRGRFQRALERKRRRRRCRRSSGEAEASPCTRGSLRKGTPTALRLLAGKVVELGIADKPRDGEADLKKTAFPAKGKSRGDSARKRGEWNKCPYARSVRWSAWTSSPGARWSRRLACAATADHPRRVDYEYERAGTASIFMFCEALSSWRRATARKRRTKADWAEEVADLLEGRYADCEKIILVCDNLNTHTPGAFYEASCRARELVKRIEFCYTPKHGSWLSRCMTRQCLRHRGSATSRPSRPKRGPSTSTSGSAAWTGK